MQKARLQPDKVKMLLNKVRTDGLKPTLSAVTSKLDQPIPLGYCNAGHVVGVGAGVSNFKIGDRVASNGPHAEFVVVPQNLAAHIPDEVSYEEATFTVVGAIGLQGIRLLKPELGEAVVVIGLGLIGLITAELLLANGCTVIGLDVDDQKLELARAKGVLCCNPNDEDPVVFVTGHSEGVGADGVIITASAKSNEIVAQAAQMSRKRGRIVLVGVVGLNLNRADFYEKELTFQVSCSYGPGRYDPKYEEKGRDYPLPFVRWTEQRNFEAILQAINVGHLNPKDYISEVVPLEDFHLIYNDLGGSKIASILKYSDNAESLPAVAVTEQTYDSAGTGIGIVGAGNFTRMTMLPNIGKAKLKYIVGAGGINATSLAKKYNIGYSATDYHQVLQDATVGLVLITTRHNLHAQMIVDSLKAGKHVFVEKPLCLSRDELAAIEDAKIGTDLTITVGFNRRFSPHLQKIKSLMPSQAGKNMVATMNAGDIPADSWVHDLETGGGRIVGEACHLIDVCTFLSGGKIVAVCMNALGRNPTSTTDNATIMIKYDNGDQATIHYFANGSKSYSKERLEVYSEGKTVVMDNYRKTRGFGYTNFSRLKTKLDKGHGNQFKLLIDRFQKGGEPLIPWHEIVNTTKASFAALESLQSNTWIYI